MGRHGRGPVVYFPWTTEGSMMAPRAIPALNSAVLRWNGSQSNCSSFKIAINIFFLLASGHVTISSLLVLSLARAVGEQYLLESSHSLVVQQQTCRPKSDISPMFLAGSV